MDGEKNGKPYEQIHDLGGNTPILGFTPIFPSLNPRKELSFREFYSLAANICSKKPKKR